MHDKMDLEKKHHVYNWKNWRSQSLVRVYKEHFIIQNKADLLEIIPFSKSAKDLATFN